MPVNTAPVLAGALNSKQPSESESSDDEKANKGRLVKLMGDVFLLDIG